MNRLPNFIKRQRLSLGWTMKDASLSIGVPTSVYCRFEMGKPIHQRHFTRILIWLLTDTDIGARKE
jgi:hypothetical protein